MNDRQQRFVAEYMVDGNGSAAARRAGYSGTDDSLRVTASRLLTNPNVSARLEQLRQQRAEATGVTAKSVLIRLNDVANRCMQVVPVMQYDHESRTMVQVQEKNEAGEMVGVYEFNAAGANRALELLGKHFGLFKEVVEHQGLDGMAERMKAARARRKKLEESRQEQS